MSKYLYELNLKEFRKNYEYGDSCMLEYIKDYITDDLKELYDDVLNYNEIYANGWTIDYLFQMGKEDNYWLKRSNYFIKKYNVPEEDYKEYYKYFEKYTELRDKLLDELGIDDRYLDSDVSFENISENGFSESEIITKPSEIIEGNSYTVARVRNFGRCAELHYCNGKATVEYGHKLSHDYWESEIDYVDWFDTNISEDLIINKLWDLFNKYFGKEESYEI